MGAKEKVLEYLKQNLNRWIHNQELRKISMANDTPRIVRALRQEGWQIEVRGDGYNRLTSLEKKGARGERRTISRKMRYEVLNRDNFRCRACGRDVSDGVKLEVDYIIPVDWGGKTEVSNLQTLCYDCKVGKRYLEKRKDFLELERLRQILEPFSLNPQSRQELRVYSLLFPMKIYHQIRYSLFQRVRSAGSKLYEE
jgi:5-methylcytosine-specific restriction endonuclease McrA